MRIFILTLGTRGDFEPFWALGRALCARGHRVTIGTSLFHFQNDPSIRWVSIGSCTRAEFTAFLHSLESESDPLERTLAFGHWQMPQVTESIKTISSVAAQSDYFMGNMKFPLMQGETVFPGAYVTYDPPDILTICKQRASHTYEGQTLALVAMHPCVV